MFKSGEKLIIYTKENGGGTVMPNCVVVQYEDGLLKVLDPAGNEVIYNVHSASFIRAQVQK